FPTVVIELPPGYTRQRAVPLEAGTHAPDFVIVRHEPQAGPVLLAMHLNSHQVFTRLLKLDPSWTLRGTRERGKDPCTRRDTRVLTMIAEQASDCCIAFSGIYLPTRFGHHQKPYSDQRPAPGGR